jgi:hypothetical protein
MRLRFQDLVVGDYFVLLGDVDISNKIGKSATLFKKESETAFSDKSNTQYQCKILEWCELVRIIA